MAFMGTMDEGYFVSRKDILGWVNGTLNTDLATVDELGKGDIYCRLIHHFHPGSVQLSKVLMEPKMEYESILNLKYLQNALERLGSTKKIDILKISKCKTQENLEFVQWLKRMLETDRIKTPILKSMSKTNLQGFEKKERYTMGCTSPRSFMSKSVIHTPSKVNSSLTVKLIEQILDEKATSDNEKVQAIRDLVKGDQENPEKD